MAGRAEAGRHPLPGLPGCGHKWPAHKCNLPLLPTFPELEGLHRQAHGQCVLDGELILTDAQGKPDFEALQARSLTSDRARVQLLSRQAPPPSWRLTSLP